MKYSIAICLFGLMLYACSPLKSSPKEERLQAELSMHEMQTTLDDCKHDLHCLKADYQIMEGRIQHEENLVSTMKEEFLQKLQVKLDQLAKQVHEMDLKVVQNEKLKENVSKDVVQLSTHANETSNALSQYKEKIDELEKALLVQNKKLESLTKVKGTLESIAKSMKTSSHRDSSYTTYRVKPGDSLEKIAKINKVSIEALKKNNHLQQDLIVVGQELQIPVTE
ncbi:MAG: LysM peptidoglycan-binding domain-containing protein [Chlamydiota bacterium]